MLQRLKNILQHPLAAHITALLGALTYLLNTLHLARTTTSYLDEGLYLYKGWLFTNGVYAPFQDDGVWTNQMPLSFLIPGYIQKWSGAGLPTARYFMIVLAMFLYLPEINVYPPQFNHIHSFRDGGDNDWLLRFGLWNENLARQWLNEADFILIEKGHLRDWEKAILESGGYEKIAATPKVEKCRWQSIIDEYQRVEP